MITTPGLQASSTLSDYFADKPRQRYSKGEVIIGGDGEQEEIYFIRSGFVKAYAIDESGACQLYVIKGAGQLMPILTLFASPESNLYYETLTDVQVERVSKALFEADLSVDVQLCFAVLQGCLAIARDTAQRIENLEITDSRQRLLVRLLFLAERFGSPQADGGWEIAVPVNYQDLADALNMTRDTANRLVKELEKEGLVQKTYSHLTVVNPSQIAEELAG